MSVFWTFGSMAIYNFMASLAAYQQSGRESYKRQAPGASMSIPPPPASLDATNRFPNILHGLNPWYTKFSVALTSPWIHHTADSSQFQDTDGSWHPSFSSSEGRGEICSISPWGNYGGDPKAVQAIDSTWHTSFINFDGSIPQTMTSPRGNPQPSVAQSDASSGPPSSNSTRPSSASSFDSAPSDFTSGRLSDRKNWNPIYNNSVGFVSQYNVSIPNIKNKTVRERLKNDSFLLNSGHGFFVRLLTNAGTSRYPSC